jgi:hypothetical protein
MTSATRFRLAAIAVALGLSGSLTAVQPPPPSDRPLPDFDIRAGRPAAAPSAAALAALGRARDQRGARAARINPHTGAIRVIDGPAGALVPAASVAAARSLIASLADDLALDASDLADLRPVRDYTSISTGLRHITFAQSIDGIPVFDGIVTLHTRDDGAIVRMTSSAGRSAGRQRLAGIPEARAAAIAAIDIPPPFRQNAVAGQVWFPTDGQLRLAWHVVVEPERPDQLYDVLVDALSGQLLLRRNRVRYADGDGRVLQSAATQLLDPRRPDQMPLGTGGPGCPPPVNHLLRSLNAPFRGPAAVLFNSGRLSGNNTHVYRGSAGTEGALGTFDGTSWSFDFPFNSAASAETALFFSMNFVHDFFYDLGFDEGAGNFQVDNFGRGGLGGDPLHAIARAQGRNNAVYAHGPDGTSSEIRLFLWDAAGCWGQDVDGDGTLDLDGTLDTDIVIHEFHHGVSLRINTAWSGHEAAAIGEGGGDFFAYSVNGDTTLAEYSRPGGIRGINSKTYANWSCLFGIFCEPHANGEIWANALWDVRERFRADLVRGSEASAINESHQIYIDALKLSPPAPTMLDMRDAMLVADSLRSPLAPTSENFCRIWESFAARGMGTNATDTADNGSGKVGPDSSVPDGCQAPPPPPDLIVTALSGPKKAGAGVTIVITDTTGNQGTAASPPSLTSYYVSKNGAIDAADALLGSREVPEIDVGAANSGSATLTVPDSVLPGLHYIIAKADGPGSITETQEGNNTRTTTIQIGPDLTVTALTGPATAAAGAAIEISDTTTNQGGGPAGASATRFFLSTNATLDADDVPLQGRSVPSIDVGLSSAASTSVTIPAGTTAGLHYVIAKADADGEVAEYSETNNAKYARVQIGPDLIVTSVSAPAKAAAGATITVTDTTKNNGTGPADVSATALYLSANTAFDASDVRLSAGRFVPALDAGASSTGSTTVVLPQVAAGTWFVLARADDGLVVPETQEGNNVRYAAVKIGPDLSIQSLGVPSSAVAGSAIVVTHTVRNTGAGDAGASFITFYLSTNSSFDAGDLDLGASSEIAAVPAGGSISGSTTLTLPSGLSGAFYIFAFADGTDAVAETSETNNRATRSITISP